jgi:hypothetical protein
MVQLDATHNKVYSAFFISTCFGHHYSHRQDSNVLNYRIRCAAPKREKKNREVWCCGDVCWGVVVESTVRLWCDCMWIKVALVCYEFGIFTSVRLMYLFSKYYYSMEHRPSWQADRFAASQEILRILWNPKLHYRMSATCIYREPAQSSTCPHIRLSEDPPYYYPPFYVWISLVVSFPQVSLPKPCTRLSPPRYSFVF